MADDENVDNLISGTAEEEDDDGDEESRERDYGEDDEVDEEGLFGDLSDDEEDVAADDMWERERRRIAAAFEEDIPREELIDFGALDEEEEDLPFSYLAPPIRQWQYALDACSSGFSVVGNLGKVSNAVLRLVADGAAMSVLNETARVPAVNNAFIRYAQQRGV